MASGKIIKLLVFELLEYAAFSIPTLVVMEQFATAYQSTRTVPDHTHYWLIVSCSIAYVALVTLLIWVPIKVLLYKRLHLYRKIIGWRPVLMMCVVLTTLPSFSFSIAVTEVQKNSTALQKPLSNLPDLPDLPVSLVVLSLIVVDIIEKLRIYPLRGSQKSNSMWVSSKMHRSLYDDSRTAGAEKQEEELLTTLPPPAPSQINAIGNAIDKVVQEFGLHNENLDQRLEIKHIMENVFQHKLPGSEDGHLHTATLQQIKTVAEQVGPGRENGAAPRTTGPQHQAPVLRAPLEPSFDSGILGVMSRRDVRAEIFLRTFMMWSDTIEMVRVAGHPKVYTSGWLYPVYLFSFTSLVRMVFTPKNPLLNSLGILLQDLPFMFLRLGLIIALGTITPILGLCKNLLVAFSYVYFNHITRLRAFSAFETSPF